MKIKKFAIIVLVLVFAAIVSVIAIQQITLSEAETRSNKLEKRISNLENANKFDEKQIKKNNQQAIFLSGGDEVYFGKITAINKESIKLENIYYMDAGTVDREGNTIPGSEARLVKLGEEVHGPEDVMYIERKNVLFWENLKNNSEVSKAIADFTKTENVQQ